LAVGNPTSSGLTLTWTDTASNEDGVTIERKTGAGSYSEVAQVGANVTTYDDSGLDPSTTYTYRVRAYNGSGNSDYSNEASGTTSASSQPPAAPSNLSVGSPTAGSLSLIWTDNATNETGVKLERKTGSGSYSQIDQVGANVTSYQDSSLSPDTTYTYRVRATNA